MRQHFALFSLLPASSLVLSTPIAATPAAPPPSGSGVGVTLSIAPAGGVPTSCASTWSGAPFGVAAVAVNPAEAQALAALQQGPEGTAEPLPTFALDPNVVDRAVRWLDAQWSRNGDALRDDRLAAPPLPAITPPPADLLRLVAADQRLQGLRRRADPASTDDVIEQTAIVLTTRTNTRTVTRFGAADASPTGATASAGANATSVTGWPLLALADGQVRAHADAVAVRMTGSAASNGGDAGGGVFATVLSWLKPATDAVAALVDKLPFITATPAQGKMGGESCRKANDEGELLRLTVRDSVLRDAAQKTGYVAGNRQLQFNSPPQAGSVLTAGWSVCDDGRLALGQSKVFWRCAAGPDMKFYDKQPNADCKPVQLVTMEVKDC